MRTIVPFVLALSLCAQPPFTPKQQIERLEERVAGGHSIVSERVALVNLFFGQRNIEARRRHVLWLIENHPELSEIRSTGPMTLDFPLSDPTGYAQAIKLWREHAANPHSSPKVLANAAFFFRFDDRGFATSILDAAQRAYPADPDLARTRGILDAIIMGGVVPAAPGRSTVNPTLAKSPDALKARAEVESSHDPKLLWGAAAFLEGQYSVFTAFDSAPVFGDEDPLTVAGRWLKRAREIEPENDEWKRSLGRVYSLQAGQTADPKWRVKLLRQADELDPNNAVQQLALAEFEAGEDEAAARDAHRLLDRVNAPPQVTQIGQTILGRIALEHGDLAEAKGELMASLPAIPPSFNFEPNRTLAQDLLDRGERDIVIQFLEQSREFWKNDQGAIDHYIKLVKAPGTHDILARYFAGSELRGRPAPKLPIDDYAGKVVAVQFRDASCKTCAADFATADKIAADHHVAKAAIDKTGNEVLVRQFEVDRFPTWVLIDREGRIADYMPGGVNEQEFARRLDQLSSQTAPLQKLPAPEPRVDTPAGTLAWAPVPGAESYVVQWDQRDEHGWLSDRADHLVRVIPSQETSIALDPSLGETSSTVIRWRVFAVSRFGPGISSDWRQVTLSRP